jgi:hypothetical protein
MGLFKKKENKKEEIPKLPELPSLPNFPNLEENPRLSNQKLISQLPSFPKNTIGEKFSQDTIKHAISGKKEGDEEWNTNDFVENEEIQMMPKPLNEIPFPKEGKIGRNLSPLTRAYEEKNDFEEQEPIFIRIDKFEEALDIFKKVQNKISDIEKDLSHLKKIKEQENEELTSWEKEVQEIKNQMETINSKIFSKVN